MLVFGFQKKYIRKSPPWAWGIILYSGSSPLLIKIVHPEFGSPSFDFEEQQNRRGVRI